MIIQNIKIKGNRIWLSKSLQDSFRGYFLDVELRKRNKKEKFFTRIIKDGRFVVPKEIRKNLELKNNEKLWIKIRRILSKKREKEFFKDNKIDVVINLSGLSEVAFALLLATLFSKTKSIFYFRGNPNPKGVGGLLFLSSQLQKRIKNISFLFLQFF